MTQTASDVAATSDAYQAAQSRTSQAAAIAAIGIWRNIDGKALDASWLRLLPRLLGVVARAQLLAAEAGVPFLSRILAAANAKPSGARLEASAFAGVTGDGRPMKSLLYTPVALSKQRIGQGQRIADVIGQEEAHIAMMVRTQVQDAGRMALQSAMAAEPEIRGYVRKLTLPSCARCIILSGRFYRYSDGFQRHPSCDCTMIPAAVGSDMVHTEDPVQLLKQMQAEHPTSLKKSLTDGDLKALEHGADLNQVVNAHRGMTTAAGPGRTVKATTEGTTVRGFAGKRLGAARKTRVTRLTPAQVFEEASLNSWSRDEVVRQLTRFGYII